MRTKVVVTADANGNVVRPSENNPEWGTIRLKQDIMEVQNNFVTKKSRYAYIRGTVKMLTGFGFTPGMELDGKIVVRESLTPFNKENPDGDLKIAGTSGVVCSYNGAPIYRKTFFETNSTRFDDEMIAHNNIDEIQAAYDAAQTATLESDLSL